MVDKKPKVRAKRKKYAAEFVAPQKLKPWPGNPRQSAHTAELVEASIRRFGFGSPIVARKENSEIISGHTRWRAALRMGLTEVPVRFLDLPEKEAHALALADNQVPFFSEWDSGALVKALEELNAGGVDLLTGTGFTDDVLRALESNVEGLDLLTAQNELMGMPGWADQTGGVLPVPTGQPGNRPVDADGPGAATRQLPDTSLDVTPPGDVIYPSLTNDWGVPDLDLAMQGLAFDDPTHLWGASKGGRKAQREGTWIFYTEDYRFNAVWAHPEDVVATGCAFSTEVNFSVFDTSPRAVALWRTYQKRWIAKFWQTRGVRVLVDLNVSYEHHKLNLLGVPKGWRAFVTRGYTKRLDTTAKEYLLAKEWSGDAEPEFLVYGGGVKVKETAQDRGWTWIPEDRDVAAGRFPAGTRRP